MFNIYFVEYPNWTDFLKNFKIKFDNIMLCLPESLTYTCNKPDLGP